MLGSKEKSKQRCGIKMVSYKIGDTIIDKVTKIDEKQKLILEKLGY